MPLYTNGDGLRKTDRLDLYLGELLSQRRVWRKSQPKKEPITGAILDAMVAMAEESHNLYGDFSNVRSALRFLSPWNLHWLSPGGIRPEYGPRRSPSQLMPT